MHWFLDAAHLATAAWKALPFKSLRSGDAVRVAVGFKHRDKRSDNELLWVKVTQVGQSSFWGVVKTKPQRGYLHCIASGQAIQFERRHVWDILPSGTPVTVF